MEELTYVETSIFSRSAYLFRFQGQEMDDEIKGDGNSVNYTYRMHDPRLGRFFAIDPLAPEYPWNSPYAFSENRVLDAIELEGLEALDYRQALGGSINPGTGIFVTTTANTIINQKNEAKGKLVSFYRDAFFTGGLPAAPNQSGVVFGSGRGATTWATTLQPASVMPNSYMLNGNVVYNTGQNMNRVSAGVIDIFEITWQSTSSIFTGPGGTLAPIITTGGVTTIGGNPCTNISQAIIVGETFNLNTGTQVHQIINGTKPDYGQNIQVVNPIGTNNFITVPANFTQNIFGSFNAAQHRQREIAFLNSLRVPGAAPSPTGGTLPIIASFNYGGDRRVQRIYEFTGGSWSTAVQFETDQFGNNIFFQN